MIFAPEMVKLILADRKTQTRRIVKPDEKACRYRIGHAYAIQPGRARPGIERLTITEVRQEKLGDISLPDAKREGFRTRSDFFDYWQRLHGVLHLERQVWVISFVKGDRRDVPRMLRGSSPAAPICNATIGYDERGRPQRCGRAFADVDYLTGAPITVCVCGARRPPESEDDHGYTSRRSSAMRGEGEAIPVKLQERYAEKAAETSAAKREEMRQRALRAINDILPHASDERERKRLRAARNQIAALGEAKTAA